MIIVGDKMIEVNCQSSIKISGFKVLYFDPLEVEKSNDADYIFITHTHYDHFSKEDILRVKKSNTKIIGPSDIVDVCKKLGFSEEDIIVVKPLDELKLAGVDVKCLYAYNVSKSFHPKSNNWVGYLVDFDGVKYYVAGDTDILDENKKIDADVVFIPVGGYYTCDYQEAAEFVNEVKPQKAIPIHYGFAVGSSADASNFKNLVSKDIEVEIYLS